MTYNTIIVKKSENSATVVFNRLDRKNSINLEFIDELQDFMDTIENDSAMKVVILEGQNGLFCTGMDLEELVESKSDFTGKDNLFAGKYLDLLKRLSTCPHIVISKIDGQVMAGGMGILATSDIVVATPNSQFSLSEALWGFLPAIVTPYLIKRIGFQKAYNMTLTTIPIQGEEAFRINLIDHVAENLDEQIRKIHQRVFRLEVSTVKTIKEYFKKMWIITDEMEQYAASALSDLLSQTTVQENIENFIKYKKFPWERI